MIKYKLSQCRVKHGDFAKSIEVSEDETVMCGRRSAVQNDKGDSQVKRSIRRLGEAASLQIKLTLAITKP